MINTGSLFKRSICFYRWAACDLARMFIKLWLLKVLKATYVHHLWPILDFHLACTWTYFMYNPVWSFLHNLFFLEYLTSKPWSRSWLFTSTPLNQTLWHVRSELTWNFYVIICCQCQKKNTVKEAAVKRWLQWKSVSEFHPFSWIISDSCKHSCYASVVFTAVRMFEYTLALTYTVLQTAEHCCVHQWWLLFAGVYSPGSKMPTCPTHISKFIWWIWWDELRSR